MTEVSPDAPRVYPPIYPYSFFHSRRFHGHTRPVTYLPLAGQDVEIHSQTPLLHGRLIADFDRMMFERVGIMMGEYIALDEGLFLMDRQGTCISINFPWDSALLAQMPYLTVNQPNFWIHRQSLIDNWDAIPKIENGTVFSHIYFSNYYHFTFELLQSARLMAGYGVDKVIMPPPILEQLFQRDLMARALGETGVIRGGRPIRMVDPVVTQTYQSPEGLWWLRRTMTFSARPGRKRYYIRRETQTKRRGNNISESPAFLAFLDRHGFTGIDFGNGEKAVAEQIAMLDGAAVIIAPHGAGLTNIAYLDAPLTLIEVFSRAVLSASFMQLAINLGFAYRGIICEEVGEDEGMVVDIDLLEAIMHAIKDH